MNVVKEQLEPLVHIVKTDQRAVPIWHVQLVVVVQVMRSTNDGNNTTKIVLAKPNDFFLSANSAVIGAETTRTLANGEFVFNDPGEVSWGNSKGPLAP
jgi:hypothetical protein